MLKNMQVPSGTLGIVYIHFCPVASMTIDTYRQSFWDDSGSHLET